MSRTAPNRLGVLVATAVALTGTAPGAAEVRFSTSFPGGSLGTIERRGDDAFRLHVAGQQDEHGRNRQASWYYFRMDGVRGRDLSLTLTDFVGEYNGKPGAVPMGPRIVPVVSEDGEHWQGVPEVAWDDAAKEATIRLRPEADRIWIAHQPPYTPDRLAKLLEQVDRCDDACVEVIGRTVRGRDLHRVTVTAAEVPDEEKVTVWLQARQHAWESGTSYVMEGALLWITSDDPRARDLRQKVVFRFLPMADPDGSASGGVRFNAHGFDVNRHWDEVDLRHKRFLALMPEIWYAKSALVRDVEAGRDVRLVLNLHNTETSEYLSTSADDAAARARVTALQERLIRETSFRPSRGPTLGSPRDTTANVLYAERGLPVVLMEQRIARDPETGRPPRPEDRLAFGAALIRILGETALP